MRNFDSAYTLAFLGLAWGFALVAIVLSWASANHGLREVTLALRSRDEKRAAVNALKLREPELRAEYRRIYSQIQKQYLIVNEQTKALFVLYLQTVRKNARYSDIDMIFPETSVLPPELSATEPPPLAWASRHDQDEREKQ